MGEGWLNCVPHPPPAMGSCVPTPASSPGVLVKEDLGERVQHWAGIHVLN